MLEQVLDHIHNYFEKRIVRDKFVISSGSINLSFLPEGQYFRIVGSVFNDGVHQYPASDLADEVFEGQVWAMAVPPAVIALSKEIETWVANNAESANSPYISESFGGYSYSKGSKSSGSGATIPIGWKDVFRDRLNHWRKIA